MEIKHNEVEFKLEGKKRKGKGIALQGKGEKNSKEDVGCEKNDIMLVKCQSDFSSSTGFY